MKIVTEKRSHDWIAFVEGKPEIWEAGTDEENALDKMSIRLGKPEGNWRCAACDGVWHGTELYQDPMKTVTTWTCGDLSCGGNCYRLKP